MPDYIYLAIIAVLWLLGGILAIWAGEEYWAINTEEKVACLLFWWFIAGVVIYLKLTRQLGRHHDRD